MIDYGIYNYLIDDNYFKKIPYDELKITKLIQHLNLHLHKEKCFISLSGGVDSMVLLDMFKKFSNTKIFALHINYNNRTESKDEASFLQKYCIDNNVDLIIHHIDNVKRNDNTLTRNEYEDYTKTLRYNLYSKIIQQFRLDGVYLAHHDDDVIENIFNNIMKNNHYEDLSVIKSENIINNVKILRPFIGLNKDYILDYANKFHIPYFKDTTPLWSCRGKMRNNIFPNLIDCYGISFTKSLVSIAQKINQTESFLDTILKEYFELIEINDNCITLKKNFSEYRQNNLPIYFWEKLFAKIANYFNIKRISKKSITNFYDVIIINNKNKVILNTQLVAHKEMTKNNNEKVVFQRLINS